MDGSDLFFFFFFFFFLNPLTCASEHTALCSTKQICRYTLFELGLSTMESRLFLRLCPKPYGFVALLSIWSCSAGVNLYA
jgi:hypothetical protein